MTLSLRVGGCSVTGPYRDGNEDSAAYGPSAAFVADGVGGGPAGELASSVMVHALSATAPRTAEHFAEMVRVANGDLSLHARRDSRVEGMATTLTGIRLVDEHLLLAHVGDSRAYRRRGAVTTRMTRDDSFVQHLIEAGLVAESDAMTHPRRNVVTAILHGDSGDRVSVAEIDAAVGDRWMLCSDGVSDYLPDAEIARLLETDGEPQAIADGIVAVALAAGSRDNVTAVVCDVVDAMNGHVPGPSEATLDMVFRGAAADRFMEGLDGDLAV